MGKVVFDLKEYEKLVDKKNEVEKELTKCIAILCELHKMEKLEEIKEKLNKFLWDNNYIA